MNLKKIANLSDCLSSFQLLCKRAKCHPAGVEMTIFFWKNYKNRPELYLRDVYKFYYWVQAHQSPFEKFWLRAVEGMQNVLDRMQWKSLSFVFLHFICRFTFDSSLVLDSLKL